MRAIGGRLRPVWTRAALHGAAFTGTLARGVPGAGGALALAYGLGQMYGPLFWVTIGGFLLLVDRRVP